MNYLAHLELSGRDADVMVGNLMGDFVKGKLTHARFTSLPSGVQKGIHLHRQIDHFTDTHEVVRKVTDLFSEQQGKYASIVVDVLFDHLLATHWTVLHPDESLESYASRVYVILPTYRSFFSERMQKMVDSMLQHQWLPLYKTVEGVQQAFLGISKRTMGKHSFVSVFDNFYAHEHEITSLFMEYYPQLQRFCSDYLLKEFIPYEPENT